MKRANPSLAAHSALPPILTRAPKLRSHGAILERIEL